MNEAELTQRTISLSAAMYLEDLAMALELGEKLLFAIDPEDRVEIWSEICAFLLEECPSPFRRKALGLIEDHGRGWLVVRALKEVFPQIISDISDPDYSYWDIELGNCSWPPWKPEVVTDREILLYWDVEPATAGLVWTRKESGQEEVRGIGPAYELLVPGFHDGPRAWAEFAEKLREIDSHVAFGVWALGWRTCAGCGEHVQVYKATGDNFERLPHPKPCSCPDGKFRGLP